MVFRQCVIGLKGSSRDRLLQSARIFRIQDLRITVSLDLGVHPWLPSLISSVKDGFYAGSGLCLFNDVFI